jgi:hypothetical protein
MRTYEAGGVIFSESSGPSAVDANAVIFSQSGGPSAVDANAVVLTPNAVRQVRVLQYIGNSTNWSGAAMKQTLIDSGTTLGIDVTVDLWGNGAGAPRNYFDSTAAPDLGWYDLLVVSAPVGSSDSSPWRAWCDESECSFIVNIEYSGRTNSTSTWGDAGPVEDFGLVSSGAGSQTGSNILARGGGQHYMSTHPSHSFADGAVNLYNDEAIACLSTGTTFVGTGIAYITSTMVNPALSTSTEAHYTHIIYPEGTTDYSTGGIVRRRSMMWGGGNFYVDDYSSGGAVVLMSNMVEWMLSTGPLIPFVGTIWTDRSVEIWGSPFRHLSTARTHAETRYQVDVSTGDWSSPVFESGWSTNLYYLLSTGYTPGTAYKVRAAYRDNAGGESRWSLGLSEVSAFVAGEAGILVEYLSSTGGVLQSNSYWTNSGAYVEVVTENQVAPANTASVRLTPVKQGTENQGVCAKEVYVEQGAIAAGYHPAPYFPERDTDQLITPSWKDLGTSTSTAVSVDWSTSRHQKLTLAHNVTFSFTGYTAGGRYLLLLQQDGTGSRTGSFSSAVQWSGGTAPTLTTSTGAKDVIVLDAESTAILHGDYRLDSR